MIASASPSADLLPASARLLVVDDHELARAGIRAMFEYEPDLEIVGEASDGHEALALCRDLQPDLVLMDVRMPGLDGLAATQAIKTEFPQIAVIMVTIYENPDYLLQALKAGAAGYVLKDATQEQLVKAIRQLLRQEFLVHPGVMADLMKRLANETPKQRFGISERLTPSETAVLRLVARGYTNREIATERRIAVGTVKVHIEHILSKLAVSDRTQAAVRAIELGLLTATD